MNTSILQTIKDSAGININDDAFDNELILHINSAFMTLRQLGVGPDTPFVISDRTNLWSEFTEDSNILPMVKSYIALKVRLLFDPPTSSSLMTAMQETLKEYEWRLNVEDDDYKVEEDVSYG